MSQPTLVYRHAVSPSRGLAATGAFLVKWVLALPHLIVAGALYNLGVVVAWIGYFVVAFTGKMPSGFYELLDIAFRWNARILGYLVGYTDLYPPFETRPSYPVDFESSPNEQPSKGWAIAGIFLLKIVALVPHLIVLAILGFAAFFATWFGYWAVLFTGSLPAGVQDFVAGVIQWNLRVYAFLSGITDEYPKFSLEAKPQGTLPG